MPERKIGKTDYKDNKKVEEVDIEPVDQRFTVNRSRSLFLEAIKRNAPEVLESLSEIALSEFSSNYAEQKVLENWANRWNINADWILEIAYETLLSFRKFPLYLENFFEVFVNDIWEKRNELSLPKELLEILEINLNTNKPKEAKVRFGESSFLIKKFLQAKIPVRKTNRELFWSLVFVSWEVALSELKLPDTPKGLQVWEADSEPRKFYLEKAESIIKSELETSLFSDLPNYLKSNIKQAKLKKVENYCDDVVKAHLDLKDSDGNSLWRETQEKPNLKRNAVWAVKFQVLPEGDFSAIAKIENVSHTTVLREVKDFLKLIGLEEKKTKRGRRKGSKNSILAMLGR